MQIFMMLTTRLKFPCLHFSFPSINYSIFQHNYCFCSDPSLYYRDMCVDNFSADVDLDSDSLYMLSEMLGTPFNPPEIILLNIFRMKRKLDILSSCKSNEQILESEHCELFSFICLFIIIKKIS